MTTPRDTLKRRYGPGFWEDAEGALHISIAELLQAMDLPNTPENRDLVDKHVHEFLHKHLPAARIIHRQEPDGPLA